MSPQLMNHVFITPLAITLIEKPTCASLTSLVHVCIQRCEEEILQDCRIVSERARLRILQQFCDALGFKKIVRNQARSRFGVSLFAQEPAKTYACKNTKNC